MRNLLLTVALAAALGCGSKNKAPETETPGTVASTTQPARAPLSLVPAGYEAVLSVDVAQLVKTPFFAPGGQFDHEHARKSKELCGATPFELVQRVWLAGSFSGGAEPILIIEAARDKADVHKCVTEVATHFEEKLVIEEEGELTAYTSPPEPKFYAAWVSDRTVVAMPASPGTESLTTLLAGSNNVEASADVGPLLGRVDRGVLAWAVGKVPPGLTTGPTTPNAFVAEVRWTTEFDIRVHLVYASAQDAKAAAAWFTGQLEEQRATATEPLASALNTAQVKSDGDTATVSVRLNEAQAAMLIGFTQGSLGL